MNSATDSTDEVCCVCNEPLSADYLVGIYRQFEKVHFRDGTQLDEVEVIDSHEIESYCSNKCLNLRREQLLMEENVRCTYPDIGPIETCSRCNGPVDMSRFHMAWVEEEATIEGGQAMGTLNPVNSVVLAVACNQCVPPSRVTQYESDIT